MKCEHMNFCCELCRKQNDIRIELGAMYTVKDGDCLSSIAQCAYGDSNRWKVLWYVNRSIIASGCADLIKAGEVIYIPNEKLAWMISAPCNMFV